jgi:hypothetical protein
MFELFTLPEHLSFVCGVLVAQAFVSGEVFCISLFVCCSIFLLVSILSVRRLITLWYLHTLWQVTYRADSHSYFFCYNHTIHLCCHKTNISDRSVVNLHGITDDIQYYTNDYGYVPLVVNSFRSFPRSLLITGFVARLTRRVSLVRDSRGRDHMVVGFTTSHAISAYHH